MSRAADLARDGVPVSAELSEAISNTNMSLLSSDLRSLLTKSNNSLLKKGDILKQPKLAELLEVRRRFLRSICEVRFAVSYKYFP